LREDEEFYEEEYESEGLEDDEPAEDDDDSELSIEEEGFMKGYQDSAVAKEEKKPEEQ